MRYRKEHKAEEQRTFKYEGRKENLEAEDENRKTDRRLSRIILKFIGLLLHYFIDILKFAFHYIFDARLNRKGELYPYHKSGKYEPTSKYGYRFFLISNKVQNIGFGFEYRGVYYFSNAHFSVNTKNLMIDGKEIRLYQQGFTVLCSRRIHNMKKPKDGEDLYLLNPYMQTIKGKCIYKDPFYYSFFPIDSVCREFTGLPITNNKGELVSIYDNFRKMDNLVYNNIGDAELWREEQNISSLNYKVERIPTEYGGLKVYRIISELGNREGKNDDDDAIIGYFFSYNSITYVSGAFIDSGKLNSSLSLENDGEIERIVEYSNLYRELWISSPDSKHNLSLPEQDEEVFVLSITGDKQKEIKGTVKMDTNQQFWVEFDGVPNRECLGLPILNKNSQLIGVYNEFNIKNGFRKLRYSVYLGGPNTFKSHFLKMNFKNPNIQILEANYDMEILEQIVSLCSIDIENDDKYCGKLVNRVIFGVGSEDILQKIYDDINLVLKKYSNLPLDNVVSIVNNSSIKYTEVQDKKFILANIGWIGYSHLNSNNSFPFNSPKSLLIVFSHSSSMLTEELLESYYKSANKAKRGFYLRLISNN
ncbi:uncharacterized protein cubi_00691 [Cryptosporidium ubiquitum]|uniref:Uncharacterized protein n=1 Tax=Cryptosporidium ubiquitum TaxID=857276 RepID=A0A1J4MEJ2_9CRYT|nr:uncharacterized protein cubi_00691 [Cryptosporidium ubiquitum]OII71883.1 hypothetical protein cubi_00691 [Cryptosporidium ubiquitum]